MTRYRRTPEAEEWRDIPGWLAYQVSSHGRVRSVPRALPDGRRSGGRILAQSADRKGYALVSLSGDGRSRTVRVHVLVAEAFLGPRPAGMQILHRNDDHSRNDVGSLRYGTDEENKAERGKRSRREKKGVSKRERGQVKRVGSAPGSGAGSR